MTNQKKFYTSSHAVVHVNSYFIDFKIQKVGKTWRKKVLNRKRKYLVHVLVYIIQLSGVSEYSEYCKSKCFWGLNFFCNIFEQYLNHFLYMILIWFLCVSLMVMFETVNKISTKPFQSIGSHKKIYSHWKHLSGVQSLLKIFDLFNS